METKKCTMCGKEKILTEFRKYPGETTKRYPYCLECQQIETRRRYLEDKLRRGVILTEEECELQRIHQLYELRLVKGLRTFGMRTMREDASVKILVDQQIYELDNTYI